MPLKGPVFGRRPARQITAAAKTVAQAAPGTLMVARDRAQTGGRFVDRVETLYDRLGGAPAVSTSWSARPVSFSAA